jgi:hypothetical protein
VINHCQFKQDENGRSYIETPEIKAKYSLNGKNVFEIGLGKMYEHMVLAHELIHLNHYIQADNKNKAEKRFGGESATALKTVSELKDPTKYPELLPPRYGSRDIFRNKEERKTVWGGGKGAKTDDDISELSLRLEAGLNPRYIYQESTGSFLESPGNLINSANLNADKIALSDFLQQMPYSSQPITQITRGEDFLKYTPLSILKEFYPLTKDQQRAELKKDSLPIDQKKELASKRLHRSILSLIAKRLRYEGELDNVHEDPPVFGQLRQETRALMKKDTNAYTRALGNVENVLQTIAKKFEVNHNQYSHEQLVGTMQSLLNENRSDLNISPTKVTSQIAATTFKRMLASKLNRKLMKEFIRYTS